ncbi:hypothetical protein ElyMa_006457200 [Elysia marginata]|uniref:Secreted protein n=1 Tax=Elysia marginata TaxID=1093978 RepID=A0AAV4HXJ1_9GAST|nr:hypothetical protein ElyMa_006457200 [Elysia marginata]
MEYKLRGSLPLFLIAIATHLPCVVFSWSQEWSPNYVSTVPVRPLSKGRDCRLQGRPAVKGIKPKCQHWSTAPGLQRAATVSTGCQSADLSLTRQGVLTQPLACKYKHLASLDFLTLVN